MTTDALVPDTVTTPAPSPARRSLSARGWPGAGAWSRTRWFGRKST
jgi:hypothetical protein